jgi:hypothetical protein
MDWLKARSVVALGMITAMRNGLGVAVGAGGAAVTGGKVTIAAVGWPGRGTTGATVGVAVAHAVASMLTNKTAISSFFTFIFFLLMNLDPMYALFSGHARCGWLPRGLKSFQAVPLNSPPSFIN